MRGEEKTMRTNRTMRWVAGLTVIAALLGGCSKHATEEAGDADAAVVHPIQGSDLSSVTLSEQAAQRIGLETQLVATDGPGLHIPYGALLYDPQGKTWAFVQQEGLTFVREAVVVNRFEGSTVVLTSGPAVGAKVVTVGSTQLYGAEIGVGDE
jgi:hypothetical protein